MQRVGRSVMWLVVALGVASCKGGNGAAATDGGWLDARDHGDAGVIADAAWPPADASQSPVDPAGTNYQYVASEILVPQNGIERNSVAFNVDGDPEGRLDNALGDILVTFSIYADLQASMDHQVATGDMIMLLDLQATALDAATAVGLWVFPGANPTPDPCLDVTDQVCGQHLDGNGSFDVDADSPQESLIVGEIAGAHFAGGPGRVMLEIPLVLAPGTVLVEVIGARAEMSVTSTTLTGGKIGGGIREDEVDATLLPAIHQALVEIIDDDCTGTPVGCPGYDCRPCGCEEGSQGRMMLDLFDENEDCTLTLQEFREDGLISSLTVPDLDLFDAEGNYNPRQDGVKDSLSVGLGFEAVEAAFTLPPGVGGQ